MPELPEVQTVAAQLQARVLGARIDGVTILRPDFIRSGSAGLASALTGCEITAVERQGKRLSIHLDGGARLYVHLGMTGRVTIHAASEPRAVHTHVVLSLTDGREVRFCDPRRFGGIWWGLPSGAAGPQMPGPLGPDALSIRAPQLRVILARRRRIKALLMDQRAISGLGNIYCDEVLHRAGIHPLTPAHRLSKSKVQRLARSIRSVLKTAVAHGGSTFSDFHGADGRPGRYQMRHRVYDREDQPCRACGRPIRRELIAGRSTHYCPRCQPLSKPSGHPPRSRK